MAMPYEVMISWRYLRAKRSEAFVSLSTWISIGGVALGVMALIVVLGVMSGFENDLRSKILGANSHIIVLRQDQRAIEKPDAFTASVRNIPGVIAAEPFVVSQVLLTTENNVTGVVLRGIDPKGFARVTNLERTMREGSLFSLDAPPEGASDATPASKRRDPIILGKELAGTLRVKMGQTVNVVSPLGEMTPMGNVPKSRTYRVTGIFETGLFEYDNSLAYVGLRSAQRFFDLPNLVSGVEARVDDIFAAHEIAARINSEVGYPFVARDWMQMNKNLFTALKLERFVMFIILVMIILVAAFNIVGALIMVVMEKRKEIAILKSMGATNRSVMKIFVLQGVLIGVAGTVLGSIGGLSIGWFLKTYRFIRLPAEVYLLETLPFDLRLLMFTLVAAAALVLTFVATLYPAWSASRVQPVDALRYE